MKNNLLPSISKFLPNYLLYEVNILFKGIKDKFNFGIVYERVLFRMSALCQKRTFADFLSGKFFALKIKVDAGICRTSNTGEGYFPILGVPPFFQNLSLK